MVENQKLTSLRNGVNLKLELVEETRGQTFRLRTINLFESTPKVNEVVMSRVDFIALLRVGLEKFAIEQGLIDSVLPKLTKENVVK